MSQEGRIRVHESFTYGANRSATRRSEKGVQLVREPEAAIALGVMKMPNKLLATYNNYLVAYNAVLVPDFSTVLEGDILTMSPESYSMLHVSEGYPREYGIVQVTTILKTDGSRRQAEMYSARLERTVKNDDSRYGMFHPRYAKDNFKTATQEERDFIFRKVTSKGYKDYILRVKNLVDDRNILMALDELLAEVR